MSDVDILDQIPGFANVIEGSGLGSWVCFTTIDESAVYKLFAIHHPNPVFLPETSPLLFTMRLLIALFFLLSSVRIAFADVKFSTPAAGASLPGGTAFIVTWADSGVAPSISDLLTYQLFLFSGSNASPQQLYLLEPSTAFAAGSTVSVTVPVGIGGTGANA